MAKILPFKERIQCPPDISLRKVPGRPRNADVRSREYLTFDEIQALMKAAGNIGRHPHRGRTLILHDEHSVHIAPRPDHRTG
jgi:hypothetical protein